MAWSSLLRCDCFLMLGRNLLSMRSAIRADRACIALDERVYAKSHELGAKGRSISQKLIVAKLFS